MFLISTLSFVVEGDMDDNVDADMAEEVPDVEEDEDVLYTETVHQKDYRKVCIPKYICVSISFLSV